MADLWFLFVEEGCVADLYLYIGVCVQDHSATAARSAVIGPDTVVGAGTTIDERCTISASVIGHGCRIGPDVRLQGCYIHDNVVIHGNVTITAAILCDRVVVKSGARVEKVRRPEFIHVVVVV
jgi:NDP-sugar pyrophosphorylase family protein